MISVKEAQQRVSESTRTLNSHSSKLSDALGFVLSETIYAPISLPPFDSSAMDGYAIRADNGESTFELIGEIQAGSSKSLDLKSGQAVRIFTGAMVPSTANAVVKQELTEVDGTKVEVNGKIAFGSNIRKRGEQIERNEEALIKGTLLNSAGIGFLASMGVAQVQVVRKPIINLIITGNELVEAGKALNHGQIYESNGLTISSAIEYSGFRIEKYSVVEDDFDATINAISATLKESDMLIVSGGISVGDYDFVGEALKKAGVEEYFYKIKQKPGKPLFFGGYENKLCFALPGNPASALSCFYNYVLPALRLQSGWQEPFLSQQKMICKNAFIKKGDRAQFLKASIANGQVTILEGQGSAMLHSFALANALVFLEETSGDVAAGDEVLVTILP